MDDSDMEHPMAKKYISTKEHHELNTCEHQNHSMKYQLFKWILELESVHLFCRMNGCLQNLVLETWSYRM